MAVTTGISWTDSTFNPWWGCVKVHTGCTHCYAERDAKRYGFDVWGGKTERRTFGDKHWAEPVKWNRLAEAEGRRHRVFCASMADVFEDHPQLPEQRKRLFDLICRTPSLDWQVLTKRPENAMRMMVEAGLYAAENENLACPQPNLWIGTSPCDQATADRAVPALMRVPAAVRFLSAEPLIGPVDLRCVGDERWDVLSGWKPDAGPEGANTDCVDWVIVGGESGSGARPMRLAWARAIVGQCQAAGVAVFVKQLGGNVADDDQKEINRAGFVLHDRKGGDVEEWPADLRVREFPASAQPVSG